MLFSVNVCSFWTCLLYFRDYLSRTGTLVVIGKTFEHHLTYFENTLEIAELALEHEWLYVKRLLKYEGMSFSYVYLL
jgi:hypothetical protein